MFLMNCYPELLQSNIFLIPLEAKNYAIPLIEHPILLFLDITFLVSSQWGIPNVTDLANKKAISKVSSNSKYEL